MGIGGSIAPFGGAKQELSIYFTIDTDNHDYGFGVSHTTTNYEYSYDLNGGFVGVSSSREKKTILDWNTYDGESFVNDYMFSSPEEQGYLNFGDFKVDPSLNGLDVNYEQSVEAIMVGAGFNLGGSFGF